jgi:hypothetical protein
MTTTGSSDSSKDDLSTMPPLPHLNVRTYNMVYEEQQQKIRDLAGQLAEVNCKWYRVIISVGRGTNTVQTSKKLTMSTQDQVNQQAVSAYLKETVWSLQ